MAEQLKNYRAKRKFDETSEPYGAVSQKHGKRLRFVVQHHLASRDHYDFRLEWDGTLKSWAVPKGPSYNTHDKRLAVQVEDHPLEYRDFEGVIPKGQYGGGTVMLWDEGYWLPLEDADKGFADGSLKFTLEGSRLKGKWALVHIKPRPGEKDTNWLLIKEKDEYANAFDIGKFTTSIKTGRTMPEIAEGKNVKTDSVQKPGKVTQKNAARIAQAVTITSPDKILYQESGITKEDVAAYYQKVSERMLPYVENRILSTVRCPKGIESACFYKKHPANEKGIVTVRVPSDSGSSEEYYYIRDAYGLLSEVQMNTLEFHTWGSRVQTLEKPDVMVFDLDPDEGMDLEDIRQGVRDLKNILDQLSLKAYLKTSGGKGYHVVIPLKPKADWDTFHNFARHTAKTMEAMWPERYTSNERKVNRHNRIFIDWMRNGRGATSVAPYSIRAREGAPVSMPISWKELDTVAPRDVTMEGAIARLRRKDPWEDFFQNDQQLK